MQTDFRQIFRYLASGLTGLFTNVSVFTLFYKWVDFHYVLASIVGFLSGVIVSFISQKFFTFKNRDEGRIAKQFTSHLILLSFNLCATTLLIVFMVEAVDLPKILSVIIANGVAALWSFVIYKRLIFHKLENYV